MATFPPKEKRWARGGRFIKTLLLGIAANNYWFTYQSILTLFILFFRYRFRILGEANAVIIRIRLTNYALIGPRSGYKGKSTS